MESELAYEGLPWGVLYGATVGFYILTVEIGFRIGRWRSRHAAPEQKGQTGIILAALLALLGFLLAFSYGTAESRFQARKQLVLKEANAIGTTFLRASFLPAPHDAEARRLLGEYVDTRLEAIKPGKLMAGLIRSEQLHEQLWTQADAVAKERPGSFPAGLFIASLNELIDLHQERVTVALRYRVPFSLIATLYFVAFLSMSIMGYGFGLEGSRNFLATAILVLAFSTVLILIVDLDRPKQRMFTVSQAAMVDVQKSIRKSLRK